MYTTTMRKILRYIKRNTLTGSFSAPVYMFLDELKRQAKNQFHPTDGRFLVNMSFDLECGFNTPLWERDEREALQLGGIAKHNLLSVLDFLRKENLPINVQVVGGLLDEDFASQKFCLEKQKNSITKNFSLFRLSPEERRALMDPKIEIGVHGFSHRRFSSLGREEAVFEVSESVRLVTKIFQRTPRFMSFPKNDTQHIDVLESSGIVSWRSNHQNVSLEGEVPLGLWFAPGNFTPRDLSKILPRIKSLSPQGYFLHLWGHFTEMNSESFSDYIQVFRENGFHFTTVGEYLKKKNTI